MAAVVRSFPALGVDHVLEYPNRHAPVHGLIEVAQGDITSVALNADVAALEVVLHRVAEWLDARQVVIFSPVAQALDARAVE